MNKLVISLLALTMTGTVLAEEAAPKRKAVQPTREEMRLSAQRHHGGFLLQPGKGHGKIAFVNASGIACDETFAKVAQGVQFYIRVFAQSSKTDAKIGLANAEAALAGTAAQAAVFGIADDTMPRLLVAPEQRWAFVNVKALKEGNPSDEVFVKRLTRELWRAFAMVCGATDTRTQECVLNPVLSLADLDKFQNDMISMERLNEIIEHMKKINVEPFRKTSYRQACKEGWAPAPTNDFQKAIWEKVKSQKEQGPVNGLKIKPPTKKLP